MTETDLKDRIIHIPARLNETNVAKVLGISVGALRSQRSRKRGLPYRKLPSGAVVYDVEDVTSYIVGTKIYTKDYPKPTE